MRSVGMILGSSSNDNALKESKSWSSFTPKTNSMDLARHGRHFAQHIHLEVLFPFATFTTWNYARPNRLPRAAVNRIGSFLFVRKGDRKRFHLLHNGMTNRMAGWLDLC